MALGKLMFCIRCQNDIAYCTCPDIEERLKAIAASGNWAMNTCWNCGKHNDLCTCLDASSTPNPRMIGGTEEKPEWVEMPQDEITASGNQYRPPREIEEFERNVCQKVPLNSAPPSPPPKLATRWQILVSKAQQLRARLRSSLE
jgi:hypothetical protein